MDRASVHHIRLSNLFIVSYSVRILLYYIHLVYMQKEIQNVSQDVTSIFKHEDHEKPL